MTQSDDARRENQAPRERIATLNAAILRLSASLKLGDSAARPAYIFNERGVGYRMAKPPDR